MDSADSIEKILMMEMEREVERNKAHMNAYGTKSSLPPPFQISTTDDHLAKKEEDNIKVEIERRLQTKLNERALQRNSVFSPPQDSMPDCLAGTSPACKENSNTNRSSVETHQSEAEERARREAEERAQREAEERAQREAEERAQREAEERAQREAEERAQREAEERAQRQAEERAQREAEERAQRQAEERARREAEERAQREAEERAQREAEERAQREAEERARREAEERAQREAEERARREAEERAQREAEERAQREAEERAQREAEERAQREAEERARREAEERARREAEERAQREAEERAQREAEERAQREAEERAQREAEERAQREAEERAQREAEERAQREAEERAQREAEERARREAEERAQREAEERAQREAEERAQREAEERAQREAEERARREAREAAVDYSKAVVTVRGAEDTELKYDSHRGAWPASGQMNFNEYDEKSAGGTSAEYDTISDASRVNSLICAGVENANGILFSGEDGVEAALSKETPPYEDFEEYSSQELRHHGFMETDLRCRRIECHQYETIREPGRCLFPPGEEVERDISTASVQLGFFRAKQVIITSSLPRQKMVARREQHSDPNRRLLSTLHCFFESELVEDPSVTFDDENLPHNAPSECMITEEELLAGPANAAVSTTLSRLSFGDPIQVWEKARGRSFNLLATDKTTTPEEMTYTIGPTANDIWVSEIDTRKPNTAVKAFAGGVPLRVECTKISGPLMEIHGDDLDPLVLALSFFSISTNLRIKVSETFFFDSAADIFYPHKERPELTRKNQALAFIPQEFMSSLYLVVHVYRPASEDFDNYADLYTRPDRYKSQHTISMKQETQLLAMTSDMLEELGWGSVHCQPEGNSRTMKVEIKKLYRRSVNDVQLCQLVADEKAKNSMRTVPFELDFTLTNCKSHEVAFPSRHIDPLPEENETMVSLLDPDVPGAQAETFRYVPCAIPILNSGFFHAYHNVYYFRVNKLRVMNTGVLRKIPASHRTYLMQICVKDQDVSLGEEGLPVIYGRGLSGKTLETSTWSSTVHNCSEFDLNDEFKIQLPLYLTDAHHIFITLYASYQKRNPPTAGQQRLYKIGYAAFPICQNGVVRVKQDWSLNFVSAAQAVVIAAGGYLTKFPEAPSSALLNNGAPVVNASTQTRTSVHASNESIAGVLREATASLKSLSQDDDVFAISGRMHAGDTTGDDDIHAKIISLMGKLPLAEILAFFPFLSFFSLALVSSPSSRVSLDCRTSALDALINMTFKAQQYDVSTQASRWRQGQQAIPGHIRTSVTAILYHHLSNNILYNGQRYRIYAGVAEVWLNLLNVVKKSHGGRIDVGSPTTGNASNNDNDNNNSTDNNSSSNNYNTASSSPPSKRNVKKQMADLSWYLFDVILRSVYLWAIENPHISRTEIFDPSFYTLLGNLCTEVLGVLGGFTVGGVLVRRVAMFVRNLSNYCDRGRLLEVYQRVGKFLEESGDMEGLCTFLKIMLEDPDALALMVPFSVHAKPIFFSNVLVDLLSHVLLHRERDARVAAAEVLYTFLCGLANNPRIPAANLSSVASQLFSLLRPLSLHWKTYIQHSKKVESNIAMADERQLVVSVLWIIYYTSPEIIHQWLAGEEDRKVIAGFVSLLIDAQTVFRYNAGTDKAYVRREKATGRELQDWDARMSTFVTAIGSRVCSMLLEDIPNTLRTLRKDKSSVVVYPFFVLLENLLHLGNSTVALQMGSAAMFESVCSLFPEIMSRTGRMSNGMVLLTFRLMSSCCQYVRSITGRTFFLMSQSYFRWNGSLARMKSLTANALVSVAESKVRNLRLAGRFIDFQFDDMLEKAKQEEDNFRAPSESYNSRYEGDVNQTGGNSGATYRYQVHPAFLSVQRRLTVSQYLLEGRSKERKDATAHRYHAAVGDVEEDHENTITPPKFSEEFAVMSESSLRLFRDVLYLQMDDSMRFKEAKVFAYFEVVRNFLRQNALREVLRWLHRLHDTHKHNGDLAEAGMVLVFIAALCFRITEMFYFIKGENSRGARLPYGLLTYVFWHDYVRVLPEVDVLFPADTMYAIVSELYVCPDDPCFSVEGQVKALKEASEHLDKDHYYEFSLGTISIVDKYLRAIGDFKGAALVHTAMGTWCTAVAQSGKRRNHRYFLVWARMEREEPRKTRRELQEEDTMPKEQRRGLPAGRSIKRVYKMPPDTPLKDFKEYSKAFINSLFEDTSLVVLTDDQVDTLPAIPEPTSKKQRMAFLHRPPNHCWVTVSEVYPSLAKGEAHPLDGFDKSMHISTFENVIYAQSKLETRDSRTIDPMNQKMSINVYELDRAFPSTTSAIDIRKVTTRLLDEYESAKETMKQCRELIEHAPLNENLIAVLKEALSPMGITPPGMYMKEVITVMSTHSDVIDAVRLLSTAVREKLSFCEKQNVSALHPEEYALVLKAVTDIECCLIAMVDAPYDQVG